MIDDFYQLNPYELNKNDKEILLRKELMFLTEFHRKQIGRASCRERV